MGEKENTGNPAEPERKAARFELSKTGRFIRSHKP